jgi:hypothetical protein
MTLHQFAAAVGADPKWVLNTTRLLGRRLRRTPAEARWLRLVRLLHQDVGLSLAAANRAATQAFTATGPNIIAAASLDGSAAVVVDRARFESSFVAALGAALTLAGPRRRGRRRKPGRDALTAARAYGVDLGLLRASLALSPAERLERLDENATFLDAVRPVAP